MARAARPYSGSRCAALLKWEDMQGFLPTPTSRCSGYVCCWSVLLFVYDMLSIAAI